MKINDIINTRFTIKGYEDLKNRLHTLVRLFNENKFPFKNMMLGFGDILIEDREECFGRIKELSNLLFLQVKLIKINDGEDYQIEVE